ncbi:type IV pilin protein [Aeromonas caviae]|uniref:type IV pilin protein n=1 Tax=Aeromonas caviae TaxID=648 RepID=UPI0038D1AA3F
MIGYSRGFSLIELMIVVAIVAILGTIAYPSYQQYVLTSHRVEAKSMLLNAANRQETYFMDFNQYASSITDLGIVLEPDARYSLEVSISAGVPSPNFTLTATASGAQEADSRCFKLMINQGNQKKEKDAEDKAGNQVVGCWE